MAYPDKINALVDVTADQTLAAGGHAARHNDVNDALDELKAVFTAPAANELALRPDGTNERFRIDSAGDVTITGDISFDGGTDLTTALASKLPIVGDGNVLQIVRATDTANRSTTSTSPVDVTGLAVTITPQATTSKILLLALGRVRVDSTIDPAFGIVQITDSSNNAISGAEAMRVTESSGYTGTATRVSAANMSVVAYATPATTSATTYKVRFYTGTSMTIYLRGDQATSQIYAVEVS